MATKSYEQLDQLVDQIGKLSVLELSELIKRFEDVFGPIAMPSAAAAPAAAAAADAPKAEEKSEYTVTLKTSGPDKIKTIKALREVTTLGLAEAKATVEGAPKEIAKGVSKDDAKKMKEKLEASGATVELS